MMGVRGRPHPHPGPTRNQCEYQRRFAQKHAEELQRLRQKLAQKIYHESKRHDWRRPGPSFASMTPSSTVRWMSVPPPPIPSVPGFLPRGQRSGAGLG